MTFWQKIRRSTVLVLTVTVSFSVTSCRLHSQFQEDLAKDVQSRYKLVTPSALQALEVLDSDMDKLLESQRADFDLLRETSENELINITWSSYRTKVKDLQDAYFQDDGGALGVVADVKKGIKIEEAAIKDLKAGSAELDKVLTSLNLALKKAEAKTSLSEDLEDANKTITNALTAIRAAVVQDPNSPLAERLSTSVGEIDKFIKQLSADELSKENRQRVFSLVVEAMRLGRDIVTLEKEAIEQDQNYHERVLALYKAEEKILPPKKELENMRRLYGDPLLPAFAGAHKFSDNEMIRERVAILARQISQDEEVAFNSEQQAPEGQRQASENDQRARRSEAIAKYSQGQQRRNAQKEAQELRSHSWELRSKAVQDENDAKVRRGRANTNRETMREILQNLARLQALSLTNEMRVKELELRRASEKYRNAKLKDVIFERQRMTLISYGLDGVVRYSQGGLRSEDINRLINIARMVAEFVIAGRV
jgi:hypothetical protein